MLIDDYDYDLPDAAIAQVAIEPRDTSRLLRVSTLQDFRFAQLDQLLSANDLLVVNRTRVRSARLIGHKTTTGGTVEALLLRRLDEDHWEAMVRPARRLRGGTDLSFEGMTGVVETDPTDGVATISLRCESGDVEDAVARVGALPLPPYFRGRLEDAERYQTMFAKTLGSAAAPTAALHFTPALRSRIEQAGVRFVAVDLEVGLDTFRPMQGVELSDHVMHTERFEVPAAAEELIAITRRNGGRVVAVGTTVVRTLETASTSDGLVAATSGESDLFITPGYEAKVVDAMITNFHAPRTTLIALVAAFIGPSWVDVYTHALESGYRFLSFGDAMFIEDIRQ